MKDILKFTSLLVLIVFSFYYTDKISTMMIYESELMKKIVDSKNTKDIPSVDAVIEGNYITPGLNGLQINELDSYYQMKNDDIYSSSKLIFNEVEPNQSLEHNKNLIINKGNVNKNSVSIIVSNNLDIINYCNNIGLKVDRLISSNNFDKDSIFEQINDDTEMSKLDLMLDKYKLNTNICVLNQNNRKECEKEQKYLVSPTYSVDNSKVIGIEVKSGDIIFIDDSLSLANFKILLKKINYRDLNIVVLSKLISEKRLDA